MDTNMNIFVSKSSNGDIQFVLLLNGVEHKLNQVELNCLVRMIYKFRSNEPELK